jgi:hypothetical protein
MRINFTGVTPKKDLKVPDPESPFFHPDNNWIKDTVEFYIKREVRDAIE